MKKILKKAHKSKSTIEFSMYGTISWTITPSDWDKVILKRRYLIIYNDDTSSSTYIPYRTLTYIRVLGDN